jgi:hypothetical protein
VFDCTWVLSHPVDGLPSVRLVMTLFALAHLVATSEKNEAATAQGTSKSRLVGVFTT